jgi:predicted signal transduction protein with EAL and GGDEF domain
MGIATVAEGVETKSQVVGLKMLGCQVAQGFYFSHPLHAAEFDQLLTRHFARSRSCRASGAALSAGPARLQRAAEPIIRLAVLPMS